MSSAAPKGLLGAAVAKAKAAKAANSTAPSPSMSLVPVPKPGVAAPGLRMAPAQQFASSMTMPPPRALAGAPLATPSASAYLGFAWLLLINFKPFLRMKCNCWTKKCSDHEWILKTAMPRHHRFVQPCSFQEFVDSANRALRFPFSNPFSVPGLPETAAPKAPKAKSSQTSRRTNVSKYSSSYTCVGHLPSRLQMSHFVLISLPSPDINLHVDIDVDKISK